VVGRFVAERKHGNFFDASYRSIFDQRLEGVIDWIRLTLTPDAYCEHDEGWKELDSSISSDALAAHELGLSFCVLLDARRPDLIAAWFAIMWCVRMPGLRTRCKVLTWAVLPCWSTLYAGFLGDGAKISGSLTPFSAKYRFFFHLRPG
jgi:hypothetical protein